MSDVTQFRTVVSHRPRSEGEDKRACLIMIKGDFIGQIHELEGESTTIGRSDDCELVLSDTRISRQHARLEFRADGFYIEDLGSTNGCWLNNERVTEPMKLYEGDKIRLDQIVFKFSYQDDDDAAYHKMMRNMAVKDDLTRIFNKRYFSESLENEFSYMKRNGSSLVLILFDIDHFKRVNDTLGHPAGDNVLKQLASLLVHGIRGYDVFARYGGEEFAFLIKGSTLDDSLVLAQRVRKMVEKHDFVYDGEVIHITVSIGVACVTAESDIEQPADLLSLADRCLYNAKESGRNRVCHP